MSKTYPKCPNIFVIAILTIFIHFCSSVPVSVTENAFTQFVAELNRNKCSLPSQVQLPFDTTIVNNFEYLSPYLEICQTTEPTNKEAVFMCKEIFDNIRNISCPTKIVLSDIISVKLSENVCQDIKALKDSIPDADNLLKRLTDSFLCNMMCDNEFEKACLVLLWSFKVQEQIARVASTQEPERSNVPVDGADMNVDSRQDGTAHRNGLPEISADPKNDNAEGAKNISEVVGLDGIIQVPNPIKLEDNPEQTPDISTVSRGAGKLEKSIPKDKKDIIGNLAVHKVTSQDSTGASKSTSSTKIDITVTQQKPSAKSLNSNTEIKSLAEMTKSESDEQNANKQLQGNVTEFDQINTGDELPLGFNTNVVTYEQTPDVNTNALPNRVVQDKKDISILGNRLPQDSSNAANQNIPVDGEGNIPGNEIPDKALEKDPNLNFSNSNDLPHESANEKSTKNADDDLHNEQNPSNLVYTIDQNKHQRPANNDDLAKKIDIPSTNSQIIKDTTEQQTVQESIQDKTNIPRDETKTDKPLNDSVLRKVGETQEHTKMDVIAHNFITNETKNTSTYQKKLKIAQPTEELGNTIPEAAGTSIIPDKKSPEKLKPSTVNHDDKSVIPSSLMETSTKIAVSLEKMEGGGDINQPAEDEADPYGDPENIEGEEYTGPDHGVILDGAFAEVSENKVSSPDVPSSVTAAKEINTSQNEKPMEFPSRNAFGQDSSDFRVISPFPEQEDGHFFFYFLSIVLLLMAGYLIFHNKQKIIALIVEGRHERNRRSHRIGYKKLETK